MRKLLIALIVLVVVGLAVFLASPLNRVYLPTATGISAKQACSLHFVSGLSLERARSLYIDPLLEPALPVLRVSIDEDRRQASASLLGLYRQTAVFRQGLGCTLVHDESRFDRSLAVPGSGGFEPLNEDSAHRSAWFEPGALDAALDSAFEEPAGGGRNTLAVVVLHRGRLVAQRYADGIGPDTPLHGWSMTKSVIAALAGAMDERGHIRLQEPGIPDSPRLGDVTLEHLLRMTSGLAMEERADGFDPNSDMLFTEGDMAGWAARREQAHAPGTHWQYMSGNTILAARRLQDELGDSLPEQVRGLRSLLFEPIGIQTAVMEVDQRGTFQGSSYLYATAHDWARLAQLFLQDGVWGSRRVLAEGWVDRVSRSTDGAREDAYGLGFWLGHPDEAAPAGIFYMNGFQGQYAFIVPSHDLVIVRLGATNRTGTGVFELVMAVIEALKEAGGEVPDWRPVQSN
ncbi:MAG: serine hydrolase [Wenzhouxiangella sp.]|jgi:CubicO group peptidase (beta-lactamase class C family)|nr:serine hydrolase [Wenzhouxiangella sp.]